jgi:FAD dependent oxidoreductase TIGR03364
MEESLLGKRMTAKVGADIAIVGAGILGLAHAYLAARARKSVVVFEKSLRATGASVRNFGMVWPIGQPAGEMLDLSLRSRELWLEILDAAALPCRKTGSLHLAYRNDEADVVREFAEVGPSWGYDCAWFNADEVLARSQAAQPQGLIGGLWSSTELTLDPRQILASLPPFLEQKFGVRFFFNTLVTEIETSVIETTAGRFDADAVIVCSGQDFQTLYAKHYAASGLTRCKLQMMRTASQPNGWQLGPSLAAGLTLRFYPAFQICRSLPALSERIAEETPEFDQWGIHALVSQTADGALTLGDSHEYGLHVDVFNKQEIDDLILDYTRKFLRAPDLTIAERWYGVYAKHPEKPLVVMTPQEGVRIVASPGGSGMTLSFGVAEKSMQELGVIHA